MTRAERAKQERLKRDAAWAAEAERVRRLGDLFDALPNSPQKLALLEAMTDRITDLYNNVRFEHGDVLLEFLPNGYAQELLHWYFDDEERALPCPTYSPPSEYEASQQGQISGQPQQPCGPVGQHPSEAHAEIVEIARDLVALWQSPNIQALPRADRNAAIEDTRKRLIEAVCR
jgi:hypothetical protein